MPDAPNPYASPLSEDAESGDQREYMFGSRLAGRGQRLVAIIIDGIVLNIVMLPAYYLFKIGFFQAPPANPEEFNPLNVWSIYATMSPLQLVLTIVTPAAAYLLVNGYLLSASGQTVGKKALGIKIVRKDGSKAEFSRLILHRYFLLWFIGLIPIIGMIFGLLDPLMIFRKSRYCLHDDIADTAVVLA
ncbi:RDD family protein [Posidoniimonas polymericola]|uniref:RDD family protein n=1 Tax=Posidoniimonas polymericola TaxID=2528002 RepID=A0A5C5XTD2_9BACT|nr:RDD family protein [Posidoniimonas polymericola]TWT65938.1 RDD family protein [Posidoniimonas polymericola]